jgi:ABC-2 type transport system ATP-binding protein
MLDNFRTDMNFDGLRGEEESHGPSLVTARGLRKQYGHGPTVVDALLGVDLEVRRGEIVGLLGPNGAGKTTLVEILEGLRQPDAGRVELFGISLADRNAIKQQRGRMGISLQHSVLPPLLTVQELLQLQRDLFGIATNLDWLIQVAGLEEKRKARIGSLSGGQQQRVAIAMALVGDPELMFLDEPTSQLDPHARRVIWDAFRLQRQRRDAAIVITTHQMEEAQQLCDRVVVLHRGRVVAEGTPAALIDQHCPQRRLEFVVRKDANLDFLAEPVARELLPEGLVRIRVETPDVGELLGALLQHQKELGGDLIHLRIEQSTLDDVFIKLTQNEGRC